MNCLLKGNSLLAYLLLLVPCTANYWGTKKRHDAQKRVTTSRAMQTINCPKMEVDMSCEDYFVAIWDGNGDYVFDSYEDGIFVDICYDPNQCYFFEMESNSDECNYKIILDGVVTKSGKITYHATEVGSCEAYSCPGQQKVYFMSYFEGYGDIDYTFHRSGQGDVERTMFEGSTNYFCIDADSCNIMARTKAGWTYFAHFDIDGTLIDSGGFDVYMTFGNCETDCSDTTLLISTNERDGNLTLKVGSGDVPGTSEVLSNGQSKTVCIDKSICTVIDGQGKAYYYFLRDGMVFEKGWASEYRYFGPCRTACSERPVLAETERGLSIVTRLATVSGMGQLADFNSPRYKAACWLIYDDLLQISESDPKLIQRYVLGVIFFTTNGYNWTVPLGFLSGKDECNWSAVTCTDHSVTTLNLQANNILGTLASEIFSLYQLESFRLSDNYFYGSIPVGFSRLNLKFIDIAFNNFDGPAPSDLFFIDGIENIQINNNIFTGTLTDTQADMSQLSELWIQSNFLTGTIPQWIADAAALKTMYLHFNTFTGQLPQKYDLQKVKKFYVFANQLTGTVPSVIFALPTLEDLQLHSNKFSGSIQLPKDLKRTSLKIMWLNDNKLTGSIPSDIYKLYNLKIAMLHRNSLGGAVPREIGGLKKLDILRLEINNLNGTVPFKNCDDFQVLSSDCSQPIEITCPCCTRCFGLFTVNEDVLSCPSSILQFRPLEGTNRLEFYVENDYSQLITEQLEYTKYSEVVEACISPTDCMTVTSTTRDPFVVSVNGKTLFNKIEGFGWKEYFGYSSDGTVKPNTCDDYVVCNRALRKGTPHRNLVNLITRFSGVDIFNGQSKQREALCWWLDDLDTKTKSEQQATLNVQRYILALLYLNNGGDKWVYKQNWMTSAHECNWYGVSCIAYEDMVDGLNLSNNNLVGPMPSELGELRGLKHLNLHGNTLYESLPIELVKLKNLQTLDLGDNRIGGTIHTEIHYLDHLRKLDLSVNRFSGTLPSEIALIKTVNILNFGLNSFSGRVPPEFHKIRNLKFLSIENNLMAGNLTLINGLKELEYIDFSNNYFTGSLPLFGKNQGKLKVALFNNNLFSGGIPADIEDMTSLQKLFMYSNKITGSLPSQLGKLRDISSVSVAYNLLKGTIPAEVSSMRNLSLMHLHSNQLSGDLNYFDYTINSFISDCGRTEVFQPRVKCPHCTECCNVDGECITVAATWPREQVKSLEISPGIFVLGFLFGILIVLSIISMFLYLIGTKLPQLPYMIRQTYQQDSVNRWMLSSSKMAWFFAYLSLLFQTWIAYMFLRAGDSTFQGNLWLYSIDCPDSRSFCTDQKATNLAGWLTFVFVVAVFLLKDLLSGLLLFYESSVKFNIRGIIAGMLLVNITTLSIVASVIFLYATSISNIAIVKDAVIVLFLNDIDEQVLMILQTITPGWCEEVEDNIMYISLHQLRERKVEEISEVIDGPDDMTKHFEFVEDIATEADIAVVDPEKENEQNGGEVGDEGSNESVSLVEFNTMKEDLKFLREELKMVREKNSKLIAALIQSNILTNDDGME